jgi:hypothetical protein
MFGAAPVQVSTVPQLRGLSQRPGAARRRAERFRWIPGLQVTEAFSGSYLTPVSGPTFQLALDGVKCWLWWSKSRVSLERRLTHGVVPSPYPRAVFRGRKVTDSYVRTALIVIALPSLDQLSGMALVSNQRKVAFIPQRPVECLDEGIVSRFTAA